LQVRGLVKELVVVDAKDLIFQKLAVAGRGRSRQDAGQEYPSTRSS
jgi:hypothetical protein